MNQQIKQFLKDNPIFNNPLYGSSEIIKVNAKFICAENESEYVSSACVRSNMSKGDIIIASDANGIIYDAVVEYYDKNYIYLKKIGINEIWIEALNREFEKFNLNISEV